MNWRCLSLAAAGCGLQGDDKGIGDFCQALGVNGSIKEIDLAGTATALSVLSCEHSGASLAVLSLCVTVLSLCFTDCADCAQYMLH